MKYADKIGAKYTAVLGNDEFESGKLKVKNMNTGNVTELEIPKKRLANDNYSKLGYH